MKRSLPVVLVLAAIAAAGGIYWQTLPRWKNARLAEPPGGRTLNIRPDLSGSGLPHVRVNLTPAATGRIRLSVDGPYVVRPVDDDRIVGRGARLAEVDVDVTPIGFRFGGEEYRVSRVEIVPETSPGIWVNGHKYRGSVRLYRRPQGTLLAVNSVPLEDYIASVVDSEMPAVFPDDARRAQAIAARTYVLYQMNAVSPQSPFDVYASTRSQKYLGAEYRDADGRRFAGESANSRQIALETAGLVCTWRGRLFCTYYSAVCGGRTTPGKSVFTDAADLLESVECRWCRAADRYRWTSRVSRDEASDAVGRYFRESGKPFGRLASIARAGNPQGAIALFEVSDGRGRRTISATALVRCFPPSTLPSARFEVKFDGDSLVFEGRGHDHGVGLCQWGARGLAESGRSCLEILEYYYPGSQVVVVDALAPGR